MSKLLFYLIIFIILFGSIYAAFNFMFYGTHPYRQWDVQAIDTMKYSRDIAREKHDDPAFDKEIDLQMDLIAQTGATHVAIATPYDEEFLPFMKRWVDAARKYKLKVWFRGNFSGWEEWFDYKKIDKPAHIAKTKEFIINNADLFEDGDIFTSCTECENGAFVDPGDSAQIAAHRAFLLEEYHVTKKAFKTINKEVKSNYYSMNGDIAKAMMDEETTRAFDGIVVIDHYVKTPEQLEEDIRSLAHQSKGTIILGEFGVSLPHIHGEMTDQERILWTKDALMRVARIPQVKGINYWVNKNGSTALWKENNESNELVAILTRYFKGKMHIIRYSN